MYFLGEEQNITFRTSQQYYISDIKEGLVTVTSNLSNAQQFQVFPVFSTTPTGVGTIIMRHVNLGLTLILEDDEDFLQWVPTTQEATLDEYKYKHKFMVHIAPASFGSPIQQCSFWTETPTRRKIWKRNGSGINVSEYIEPVYYPRIVYEAEIVGGNCWMSAMIGDSSVVDSKRLLPDYSTPLTDALLDGAFFKLTRPEYPYQGLFINQKTPPGTSEDAYCVFDANDLTFIHPNEYEVPIGFYAFQLERQFDSEGIPTGHWKIVVNWFHGYLGTPELTESNSDKLYVMSEKSDSLGDDWKVKNFVWDITIDESKRTIQFENVNLRNAGEPNRYWGACMDTNAPFTQMRSAADVSSFTFDILFIPIQYEMDRYASNDKLVIQCCENTVDEFGNSPSTGVGEEFNYEIYCPAEYSPTNLNPPSSAGFILPQSTSACETFITNYCTDSETKNELICSCINLTDLPLLPENATITTYELCFSNNCRNHGYVPLAHRDTLGDLSCPLSTLCDILVEEEEKDGDVYNDAQFVLGCASSSPEPEPEPEGLSILWISVIAVGGVIVVGLIIGLVVGSSKKK